MTKEECEIETSKAIMEMRNHITDIKKENAELKKLIKNIIRVTWGEGWNYSLDVKLKAEQFLKEVEE